MTGHQPKAIARWLTAEETRIQGQRHRLCDEDGRCPVQEVRISVTTHQRKAGEIRAYEHFYCGHHGKLKAFRRNVPIEGTPDGGGGHE